MLHNGKSLKNTVSVSATSPLYWGLWSLARVVAKLLFSIRFTGQENIPRKGGLIIAANHASFLDIPLLGSGVKRRLFYIGRHNLFPIPIVNPLLQHLGWIPMLEDRGDRNAFRRAEQQLLHGNAVVIFPEGARTKNGQLGEGRPGVARLVARTGCPVLPVHIAGTFEALPRGAFWPRFHPVTIVYGRPINFTPDQSRYTRKQFYRHVSQTVMHNISILSAQKDITSCQVSELDV